MRIVIALIVAVLSAPVLAVEYTRVLHDQSQVIFVSKQMGVPVDGRFHKFDAQLRFDPARPEAGAARIEVELGSVDIAPEADAEVKGKGWFNIAAFPKATFVSSSVKALGGNRYEVRGKLTIKGVTREVVAPVSFHPDGANGRFEGGFALRRTDHKIGEGVWSDPDTVADEVQVKFRFAVAPGTS